jgi:hypothetical protein
LDESRPQNDDKETDMSDWLHNLGLCRGRASALVQGTLSWLAFALGYHLRPFVAFTASQVWTDTEKAKAEIDREASALRTVVILATTFPREAEEQLRGLIRRYIADAATQEWAMIANRTASLRAIPGILAEALQATLALTPVSGRSKDCAT